ncbi:unnamed protein product [Cochlearia groenlandica]
MARFTLSRSLIFLLISLFSTAISISQANPFSTSTTFGKNTTFDSKDIALYGGAKLLHGGSTVQLNGSASRDGGGRVVYKKPIDSSDNKNVYFLGFSTVISFSMSHGHDGRLGFSMFPSNNTFNHSLLEVNFDISDNFTEFRDSNVTVIVNGTIVSDKTSNLTFVKEEKKLLLYACIDYQASTRLLTVWLNKAEDFSYLGPLFSSRIDSLKDENEFTIGVKSYKGSFDLLSWSIVASSFPRYIHSYALILVEMRRHEEEAKRKRRAKIWEVVTRLVMTFGSTGLVLLAMMYVWSAFKSRRKNHVVMVVHEECGVKTKELEYGKMEKIEVAISKTEAKQEMK